MNRLYFDEDSMDEDLVSALRARGVDVITAFEKGMIGRVDDEHLDFATLQALAAASALYSYGRKTKNTEVQEIANTTESRLRKLRDTELASRATSIHTQAAAHAADLADYGVTATMITDLQAKIADYSAAIGDRESGVADRVGATAALSDLFDQTDDVLTEDLDRLMELVRESQTDFYNKYFAARVIKDIGFRHKPTPPPPTPPPGPPPTSTP